jgi:hypothetical protein
MKVSEFLRVLDGHGIYDAAGLADDFERQTGRKPCWPTHSVGATVAAIDERGLGGYVDGEGVTALGYEVAEALAGSLVGFTPYLSGRGSRFRAAVEAIQAKGL